MKRGKRTCKALKEVRMQVAKANDIKYAPTECRYEGDCAGTCPKCESEVRWLEQQLQLRRQLGKAVAVVGVSIGLAAITACDGKLPYRTAGEAEIAPDSMLIERHFSTEPDYTEHAPSFPGGQQALIKYLNDNIQYPEQAKKDSIFGRVVVGFVVETDGSITDPEVARCAHPLLDAEALRVVKLMPKWEPGYQNGTPVKQKCFIPVTFKLDVSSSLPSDKNSKKTETKIQNSFFMMNDNQLQPVCIH